MSPLQQTLEDIEKDFEKIENKHYPSGMPENYLKPQQLLDIKSFLSLSHIKLLQSVLASLPKERTDFEDDKESSAYVQGYNSCLATTKTLLTNEIERLKI